MKLELYKLMKFEHDHFHFSTFTWFSLCDLVKKMQSKISYIAFKYPKMKILILIPALLLGVCSYAQYSNYYNVNAKLNVSGTINENKTITTIDYGSLAIANAQREKNAIDLQRIQDERARKIAISIAEDPIKAYEYGSLVSVSTRDKKMFPTKELLKSYQNESGFRNFQIDYQLPNSLLFSKHDPFYFQNTSKDGVKTDVFVLLPINMKENKGFDIEGFFSSGDTLVGKEFETADDKGKMRKAFAHKHMLSRATVSGISGYRNTVIWEDKFEYFITDEYSVIASNKGNVYNFGMKVVYSGDKNEVNFEKLEGRRYYFKQLVEKIIATSRVGDLQPLD